MSIRKQYDIDLESLKNSLTEMGRNSADAVENALEALCVADADAAAAIVKGDARINNMERDIEHRCMTLLLRQQPVAGDLRRISTAMKVVSWTVCGNGSARRRTMRNEQRTQQEKWRKACGRP